MQERIDCTIIDSDFKLSEAISSLKFYWNLAKHRKTPMTYELWSERGAIVPPMEATVTSKTPRGSELQPEELPKLVVPANGTVAIAGETSWEN